MAIDVKFEDRRLKVYDAIEGAIASYLTEASGEVVSRVARNTRVDTGQLKASWQYEIDDDVAYIGSPLENAIWEEFGTGIHADGGKGRQSGWVYTDRHGETHFTRGKHKNPNGLLFSFNSIKEKLVKRAQEIFKVELR